MSGAARPLLVMVSPSGGGRTSVGGEIAHKLKVPFTEMERAVELQAGERFELITVSRSAEEVAGLLLDAAHSALETEGIVTLVPSALEAGSVRVTLEELLGSGVPLVAVTADITTLARRNGLNAPRSLAMGQPRKWFNDMVKAHRDDYLSVGATEFTTTNMDAAEVADQIIEHFALQ